MRGSRVLCVEWGVAARDPHLLPPLLLLALQGTTRFLLITFVPIPALLLHAAGPRIFAALL